MKQILDNLRLIQKQKRRRKADIKAIKSKEIISLAFAANFMKCQRVWN